MNKFIVYYILHRQFLLLFIPTKNRIKGEELCRPFFGTHFLSHLTSDTFHLVRTQRALLLIREIKELDNSTMWWQCAHHIGHYLSKNRKREEEEGYFFICQVLAKESSSSFLTRFECFPSFARSSTTPTALTVFRVGGQFWTELAVPSHSLDSPLFSRRQPNIHLYSFLSYESVIERLRFPSRK